VKERIEHGGERDGLRPDGDRSQDDQHQGPEGDEQAEGTKRRLCASPTPGAVGAGTPLATAAVSVWRSTVRDMAATDTPV
jgi:hypothetical protein